MKKWNSRILSLALALGLCLSLLPAASAAGGPPSGYTSSTGIKLVVREGRYSDLGDGVYQDLSGMEGNAEALTDADGNVLCILDGETIDRTSVFNFGLAPAKIFDPNTAEEGYGYINKYGEVVVEPKYEYASVFTESGLARVRGTGYKFGYIDPAGREVIPCQYDTATDFSGGYAAVKVQVDSFTSTVKVIDTTGKTVWESPARTSSDGFNTITSPVYDFNWLGRQEFVDGKCAMLYFDPDTNTRYPVLLDVTTGQVQELPALAYEYDDSAPVYLGHDRFRYEKNDHASIVDLEGNVIIPYGNTYNDYCFWGFVETDEGIVDLDGNLVFAVGSGEDTWATITLLEDGKMNGTWPGIHKLYEIALDDGSTPVDPEPTGDQPSSWAQEQVNAAVEAGLVPESLQAKYTQTATRAEFCALAVELYETVTDSEITQRATFSDTSDVNVQKMAGIGVISGIGNNQFNPNGELTREQAATILVRLADALGRPLPEGAAAFADNSSIASWAIEAVGRAKAGGIMDGTGNNQFSPQGAYTREQSIMTAYRLFETMQ